MKTKKFYDHLVTLDEVTTTLESYHLSKDEHEEMVTLMTRTIHYEVINVVLKRLPKEKHEDFLKMLKETPEDSELLNFLKKEVGDIEEEIKTVAQKVKNEFLVEIKRATK